MAVLPTFRYEHPDSMSQLADLLASCSVRPAFLSGGTDLIPAMRSGKESPSLVIDLKGLSGLSGIRATDSGLWIGALTPVQSLRTDALVQQRATALRDCAQYFASWQVRNRATIGGNLGNGAPTADTAAPLVALGAEIVAWRPQGSRTISSDDFWVGAGQTALQQDEIITAVELSLEPGTSSAYLKLGPREAMDIAIAGAGVVLRTEQGRVREVRIALGGAGSTPVRAHQAEAFLLDRKLDAAAMAEAGCLAARASNPRTSRRASREYRLAVIPVLVERALRLALERQAER